MILMCKYVFFQLSVDPGKYLLFSSTGKIHVFFLIIAKTLNMIINVKNCFTFLQFIMFLQELWHISMHPQMALVIISLI